MNPIRPTRRNFLKTAACGALALAARRFAHGAPAASEKPNIIFVMVDDMGYGDVGCFGQKKIKTPHIDRMAAQGTRFTQCYTGSPVCAPCRCILMTGLHSGHCRRRGNRTTAHGDDRPARKGLLPLAADDFTVAAMLKEAGYTTGGFGKWGLGNPDTTGTPDKHGFDLFYGYLDQVHAHNYYTDYLIRNTDKEELPGNKDGKKEQYTHDVIAAETFRFIRENRDNSFFCYVPWTIPHGKYVVPDQGPYEDEPWGDTQKNYAAMITRMDADLGKLFALLEELGIDEKTIVFFTSDNGPNPPFIETFDSNGPFRGVKRQLYEGGIRMPTIVRWPGKVPAGATSDFVWTFTDFMPTAAALAAMESIMNKEHIDSVYWPLLEHPKKKAKKKN